jgi:orotate phosphoribosyltransferase
LRAPIRRRARRDAIGSAQWSALTSGGAVLEAVAALRDEGALIERVVCVIDRQAGGVEQLAKASLRLDALFNIEELSRGSSTPPT